MSNPPAGRIVEVEWEDAATTHRWHNENQHPTVSPCRTVGYVVKDDGGGILLAHGLDQTESTTTEVTSFDCETIIPRSAIRKVTELKPEAPHGV